MLLLLTIDHYLFVLLHILLIKPHMDPNSVDFSLQRTLPPSDPVAFLQLTTEVSAQANVLGAHQQQLSQLTLLKEKLVKMLQSLHLPRHSS